MSYTGLQLAITRNNDALPIAVGLLGLCLFLQRFGVTFSGQSLNVVGPAGLVLALTGIAGHRLTIDVTRFCLFLAMLAVILAGSAFNTADPNSFIGTGNLGSTAQFLGITSFAVLSFAEPVSEQKFFAVVQKFLVVIAIAGLSQFFAQFAGLRLFSFQGIVPSGMLVENGWNLEIASGLGDLLKSNGFFLVEPSVMSQFMAVGIAIELLFFRRPAYLCGFIAGFLVSFSGTGGLVLFGFALSAALRLGWRGVALAVLLVAVLALAAGLTLILVPDFAGVIQSRLGEISTPGTSGHLRFVTPFWLLGDILNRVSFAALLGVGGGTVEHLTLPYEYDVNTPVKISLEFGFPVLIGYVALFVANRRTPRQSVLVLPGLILLMLTGAYQQFAPVVYFIALLLCVARLEPDPALAA